MDEYCTCFSGLVADKISSTPNITSSDLIPLTTDIDYLKKCEKLYKSLKDVYKNCKSNHNESNYVPCDLCKKVLFEFNVSSLEKTDSISEVGQQYSVAMKLFSRISECICSVDPTKAQMTLSVCVECNNIYKLLPVKLRDIVNIYQIGLNLHMIMCKCNKETFCGKFAKCF